MGGRGGGEVINLIFYLAFIYSTGYSYFYGTVFIHDINFQGSVAR